MKKITALMLILSLAILTSCGKANEETTTETPAATETNTEKAMMEEEGTMMEEEGAMMEEEGAMMEEEGAMMEEEGAIIE